MHKSLLSRACFVCLIQAFVVSFCFFLLFCGEIYHKQRLVQEHGLFFVEKDEQNKALFSVYYQLFGVQNKKILQIPCFSYFQLTFFSF